MTVRNYLVPLKAILQGDLPEEYPLRATARDYIERALLLPAYKAGEPPPTMPEVQCTDIESRVWDALAARDHVFPITAAFHAFVWGYKDSWAFMCCTTRTEMNKRIRQAYIYSMSGSVPEAQTRALKRAFLQYTRA